MSIATLKAKELYNASGLEPDFDIDNLVYRLGGRVEYIFNPLIDAYVEKVESTFRIVVDGSKPRTRQKFSIAHEIGHLILHMDYLNVSIWESIDATDSRRFRYGYDFEEIQANEFAAELLMPKDDFVEIAINSGTEEFYDLDLIASVFGTSIDSVRYRGHKLGLWDMNS